MSWKERFTGLRWQHKDPQVRARAVTELDDPRLLKDLPKIAAGDSDSAVRLAALERLNQEAWWLEASQTDADPDVRARADACLPRFFRKRAPDPAWLEQRLEWLKRAASVDVIQQLATDAPDQALRAAAIARISAQGFLGDRVVAESDDAIAAAALARISQSSTLERIAEALRTRSKQRYTAVQERLAQLGRQPSNTAQDPLHARLCREMEALARGAGTGDLKQRFDQLMRAWNAVPGSAAQDIERRFEGARAIVDAALNAPPPQPADQDDTPQVPAPEATAQANLPHAQLQSLHKRIRAYQREAGQNPDAGRVKEYTAAWDRAWSLTGTPTPADNQLKQQVLGMLAAMRDQAASQDDRRIRELERVNTDLSAIEKALAEGNLADAQAALHTARADYNCLSRQAKQRHGELNQQLNLLYGRLREMRDWQHWSNNKIRNELIAEITALPEQGLHPDAIAAKLSEARATWQRLETQEILPGDKKKHASAPWLWRKFQAVCQQAYSSAKPYFQARDSLQQEKHAELVKFLSEVQAQAEQDDPDIRALQKCSRQARVHLRGLDAIPAGKRREAAGQLRALLDRITERLEAHWGEIEKIKQKLIHEARQLEHERDPLQAIARAKQLQQQWQKAGSAGRRREQALWKAFRAPMDPIFDQAKQTRVQQDARTRQAREEQAALCKEAEALAQCPPGELEAASGRMAGLSQQWAELKVHDRRLRQRFGAAEQTLERRLLEQDRKQARALKADSERRAELLQQAWNARINNALNEQLDNELRDAWPDAGSADTLAAELRRRFVACLADEETPDFQGNEAQARQVLVEMEFLAGLPSPAEDKEPRMAYQVQRLSEQLAGGERRELATEVSELSERWQCCFPLPPEHATGLIERHKRSMNLLDEIIINT